jgi:hypothetical protein
MNIYQMLAAGGGISEEKKEGILWGMELMGLQTEKWFDNDEHANAYRNDTVEGCGFSGWKETIQFTRGFLDAEQPESDENEGISMIIDDGSETSDMELTSDDETDEDDDCEEEDDEEEDYCDEDCEEEEDDCDEEENYCDEDCEEEDDEEWNQWDNFTYEGVSYMVGPGENNTKVVLDVDNYHQVGIIVDMESGDPAITFEDNATYENHMEKVRETMVPKDGNEAVQFLLKFIQNNYPGLKLCEEENGPWFRFFPFESKRGSMFVLENHNDGHGRDFGLMTPHAMGWTLTPAGLNFHLWKTFTDGDGSTKHYHYTQSQKDCSSDLSYDPRGKKMGEVMKEIEKAL